MKWWQPTLTARDWRALIALIASIVGASVLTVMLGYIVHIFEIWKTVEPMAKIAYGLLAIIGIILVSLGMAINRRQMRVDAPGFSFDASGGDNEQAPPNSVVTTTATVVTPPPNPGG